MLRSIKELLGYKIEAADGAIGKVHDFFFDDEIWAIRYIVVDAGSWLKDRKVLLVPSVAGDPDWKTSTVPVRLTKEQVKDSPEIDTDKPVSRQAEVELHKHFEWTPYWIVSVPGVVPPVPKEIKEEAKQEAQKERVDPHLRSVKEVAGYRVQATDGSVGHVEQFIADDTDWFIRYMVVDIRTRLIFWKKVLISPEWIDRVSWPESNIFLDLPKKMVKNSPEYNPSAPANRQFEERLYDYYGRPRYWE
jgi:hypothetical protein